ncbi:hypothetical protein [Pedobacter panaciterrae]
MRLAANKISNNGEQPTCQSALSSKLNIVATSSTTDQGILGAVTEAWDKVTDFFYDTSKKDK